MIIFLLITITFLFLSNVTNGILVALYLKKKHTKEKNFYWKRKKHGKRNRIKCIIRFSTLFLSSNRSLEFWTSSSGSICLFSRPRIRDSSFEGKTIGMEN